MNKPNSSPPNPLALCARVIAQVIQQRQSLSQALSNVLQTYPSCHRALMQQICHSTLRDYPALNQYVLHLLKRPLARKHFDIHALLCIGLDRLSNGRTPPPVTVSETVKATAQLKKTWAQGLINGTLRHYIRQQPAIDTHLAEHPEVCHCHPQWLLEQLQNNWPNDWLEMVAINNLPGYLTLRLRGSLDTQNKLIQQMTQQGISFTRHPMLSDAILLNDTGNIQQLPGYKEGDFIVQNVAAQCAAPLLHDIKPGDRVLDAGAAPGGKSAHLLDLYPTIQLHAIDNNAYRMAQFNENCQRLHLNVSCCLQSDILHPDTWWDGQLYDHILIDAPCSATGILRRHPEITLQCQPDDITHNITTQAAILDQLWHLLKPGGQLLYTTCSVLPAENAEQIQSFLSRHTNACKKPCQHPLFPKQQSFQYQLLPAQYHDGFYYALLTKSPN